MDDTALLNTILQRLYRERGVDFRRFKAGTLQRRIEKRLLKRGLKDYAAYLELLNREPDEYDALFNELTINVTDFFRDDKAFNPLRNTLANELAAGRLGASGTYRVWSAACATGEEPYSVAILLAELLGEKDFAGLDLEILATDIDRQALLRAAGGLYPQKNIAKLHPEWQQKYFRREGNMLRVIPDLRERIDFREHNLFTPPPLGEVDLLLCRNVLIYFSREAQEQVLFGFHRVLKPRGLFLMGRSEIPMDRAHGLFEPIDFPGRLYRRK